MIRNLLIITTIMLGWINMPAQAFLPSSDQNLWPVLSQQFGLHNNQIGQDDIRKQIDIDLHHPRYIHRLTVNARPYLYTVFQETQKMHMPAELALLPMIESEYTPSGYSDKGAVGLWQLMPGIAHDYGVKINYFYDGRKSTAISTKVALHFLSYLYQQFDHNWLLALAAYNAGPGTVMAAIHYNEAHGRPTDFWALRLPRETEVYVPKLLALAAIIQHPNTYGIHLAPVPDKPVTSTVTINKQMKLKTIASLAHTSVTTVKKLNPALRRQVTPPHQTTTLVLPANKKTEFVKHLATHKAMQKAALEKNMGHYMVKKGDSLSTIAKKFKTTIKILQEINQLRDGMIRANQALLVPKLLAKLDKKEISKSKKVAHTTKVKHTVAAKKTIAHHDKKIVAKKTIAHHDKKIIAKKVVAHNDNTPLTHEHAYIVRRGDNLHELAARFDTTTYHIMQHNHLKTAELSIGQHLQLPNA